MRPAGKEAFKREAPYVYGTSWGTRESYRLPQLDLKDDGQDNEAVGVGVLMRPSALPSKPLPPQVVTLGKICFAVNAGLCYTPGP